MKKQFYLLSFLLFGGALALTNTFNLQDSFGQSHVAEYIGEEDNEEKSEDCWDRCEGTEEVCREMCGGSAYAQFSIQ